MSKSFFFDIMNYSLRRTLNQVIIIESFMECIRNALKETSKEFIDYCQDNNINFLNDVIFIPTGDGAAVVFPFSGIHDVHLFFAKSLLKNISNVNKDDCEKYNNNK